MRPGKLALVIAGALIALLGVAFAMGGGALLVAHTTQRDGAGFYATSTERFFTPNYALTSTVDLGQKPGRHDWDPFEHLATVRLRAQSSAERPLFIGIAPRAAVDRYLAGVAHDESSMSGLPRSRPITGPHAAERLLLPRRLSPSGLPRLRARHVRPSHGRPSLGGGPLS